MKTCSFCNTEYDNRIEFCFRDGHLLEERSESDIDGAAGFPETATSSALREEEDVHLTNQAPLSEAAQIASFASSDSAQSTAAVHNFHSYFGENLEGTNSAETLENFSASVDLPSPSDIKSENAKNTDDTVPSIRGLTFNNEPPQPSFDTASSKNIDVNSLSYLDKIGGRRSRRKSHSSSAPVKSAASTLASEQNGAASSDVTDIINRNTEQKEPFSLDEPESQPVFKINAGVIEEEQIEIVKAPEITTADVEVAGQGYVEPDNFAFSDDIEDFATDEDEIPEYVDPLNFASQAPAEEINTSSGNEEEAIFNKEILVDSRSSVVEDLSTAPQKSSQLKLYAAVAAVFIVGISILSSIGTEESAVPVGSISQGASQNAQAVVTSAKSINKQPIMAENSKSLRPKKPSTGPSASETNVGAQRELSEPSQNLASASNASVVPSSRVTQPPKKGSNKGSKSDIAETNKDNTTVTVPRTMVSATKTVPKAKPVVASVAAQEKPAKPAKPIAAKPVDKSVAVQEKPVTPTKPVPAQQISQAKTANTPKSPPVSTPKAVAKKSPPKIPTPSVNKAPVASITTAPTVSLWGAQNTTCTFKVKTNKAGAAFKLNNGKSITPNKATSVDCGKYQIVGSWEEQEKTQSLNLVSQPTTTSYTINFN